MYDDCNLLTEKSVSTCSQISFYTYSLSKKKKNTKLTHHNFEFALSTTCSAEKTETFVNEGNNVTILSSDKSSNEFHRFKFKFFDSDKNNKSDIGIKNSLDLHTPSIASISIPTKIDTLLIELIQHICENIIAEKSDFDNFIRRNSNTSKVLTDSYSKLHNYQESRNISDGQTNKNEKLNETLNTMIILMTHCF